MYNHFINLLKLLPRANWKVAVVLTIRRRSFFFFFIKEHHSLKVGELVGLSSLLAFHAIAIAALTLASERMPALTSDAIVASPRWGAPFCGGRSGEPRTRRTPSSAGQGHGCGWPPLDRVAGWVGGGIAAVFFASLERCSCFNVRTYDDLLDDEQRDSEAPLMFDDGNGNSTGVERRGARRCGKGRRTGSGDF